MIEDTAVAESPNTVVEAEPTTPPIVEPEAEAQVTTPETVEDEVTPETVPSPEEAEEPEWTPPSSQEELDELLEANRKKADASARESERRKYDDQKAKDIEAAQRAAYDVKQREAAGIRRGGLNGQLQTLANGLLQYIASTPEYTQDGKLPSQVPVNPAFVSHLFDTIDSSLYMSHYEARKVGYDVWIKQNYPDFRPSEDVTAGRERAIATGDWGKVVQSEFDLMLEAVTEKLSPELREKVKGEMEAESKAAESEEGTAKRQRSPKPTAVGGEAPGKVNHQSILSNPEATPEQKDAAFKALYGFDPD